MTIKYEFTNIWWKQVLFLLQQYSKCLIYFEARITEKEISSSAILIQTMDFPKKSNALHLLGFIKWMISKGERRKLNVPNSAQVTFLLCQNDTNWRNPTTVCSILNTDNDFRKSVTKNKIYPPFYIFKLVFWSQKNRKAMKNKTELRMDIVPRKSNFDICGKTDKQRDRQTDL